jgi:hypothetical protein
MNINFHIDQISEIMKYLDELPHKYARGLIEYIQNHVKTQLPQPEKTEITEEKQEYAIDGIQVQFVPADELPPRT